MSENAKLTSKGELVINIPYIVDNLTNEERKDIMRYVWFNDHFITELMDVLVNGYVNTTEGDWSIWHTSLEKIRKKLLPLMDSISAKTIEELTRWRDYQEKSSKEYMNKVWKLENTIHKLNCELEHSKRSIQSLQNRLMDAENKGKEDAGN